MTITTPAASRRGRRSIRGIAGLLTGAALLGTIACSGGDSSTGPGKRTNPAAGLYALRAVNKKAIPFQIYRGAYYYADIKYTFNDLIIQVTGGELILQDNGAFHLAVDLKFAAEGQEDSGTRSFNGTYEIRGSDIVFSDASGSVTGSLQSGNVVLLLDVGGTGTKNTYRFEYTP